MSVHEVFVELKDDIVPGAIAMTEMDGTANQIAHGTMEYILTGDAEAKAEVQTASEWLENSLAAHKEHEINIGYLEKKEAEKLEEAGKKLISVANEIINLKDQGVSKEVLLKKENEELDGALYPFVEHVMSHKAEHLQELSAAETRVHGKHYANIKYTIILGLVATLLGLLIALLVDRLFMSFITERKKAAEVSRKAGALETLSTVLENFIGDSLSNLLTPIYGGIELCEIRDSIEQIKGELGNIKGGITKLLTGISAYRKFTKAGESSLGKISSVDISSILGPFLSGQPLKTYGGEEFPIDPKVKLQFTYNPKQKGSVSWEELPSVSGSKLAVATALQETLINAVESYDPKKGGDVVVSVKKEDHNLILEIADKGRGMSNEDRDKSQLPFFKVLGVKGSGRLGLGAYIALESAKYCGGDIHIKSREGVGTTASISFKVSDEVS